MILKDMFWEGKDLHILNENDEEYILKGCYMTGYDVICDDSNNSKEDIKNNVMNVTVTFKYLQPN